MGWPPFEVALFVFCNKRQNKLKVLYRDQTGFYLWQKRLEQDRFRWPRHGIDEVLSVNAGQFSGLLRDPDTGQIRPHKSLKYKTIQRHVRRHRHA